MGDETKTEMFRKPVEEIRGTENVVTFFHQFQVVGTKRAAMALHLALLLSQRSSLHEMVTEVMKNIGGQSHAIGQIIKSVDRDCVYNSILQKNFDNILYEMFDGEKFQTMDDDVSRWFNQTYGLAKKGKQLGYPCRDF